MTTLLKRLLLSVGITTFVEYSEVFEANRSGDSCEEIKTVSVGVLTQVDKKPALIRQPYNDISPAAVAYSLYRYAENKKRYALTVSEFYDARQTEGIYRQFGVLREELESILRVLTLENNRVLEANLNMGLDNINLREDLTSMDVLTMLM